jgi:TatD DNase family protein
LFAAGYIEDAKTSYDLALKSDDFFATVGVHPCRAMEPFKGYKTKFEDMSAEERDKILADYFNKIDEMLTNAKPGKYLMVGECGLDYDRFNFAGKEAQHLAFTPHFALAKKFNLPMYLHSRATGLEFAEILKANRHMFPGGVVHSFTGDLAEMEALVAMDLYIGVNGCSLKTEENLEVLKQIPLDRIMLETDCPYCDIRNSHAGSQHVKTVFPRKAKDKYDPEGEFSVVRDRNEPCTIV